MIDFKEARPLMVICVRRRQCASCEAEGWSNGLCDNIFTILRMLGMTVRVTKQTVFYPQNLKRASTIMLRKHCLIQGAHVARA